MAFQSGPVLDESYVAAEDLRNYQYHFVTMNTDGQIALMDTKDDIIVGVLQNIPNIGEEAVIRHLGISKVVANASLDEGTKIKAEFVSVTDCGKAAANTTTYTAFHGVVVGASAAEDDLCSVLLRSSVIAKAY